VLGEPKPTHGFLRGSQLGLERLTSGMFSALLRGTAFSVLKAPTHLREGRLELCDAGAELGLGTTAGGLELLPRSVV
jgi:hypothetical protein